MRWNPFGRRSVPQAAESSDSASPQLSLAQLQAAVNSLPLGVMIEVPGAALSADALALAAEFFAIGTNDLTMYTLAIDRADDQVATLYNPLHPAVLRLIQFSAAAALRTSISTSIPPRPFTSKA